MIGCHARNGTFIHNLCILICQTK